MVGVVPSMATALVQQFGVPYRVRVKGLTSIFSTQATEAEPAEQVPRKPETGPRIPPKRKLSRVAPEAWGASHAPLWGIFEPFWAVLACFSPESLPGWQPPPRPKEP